MGLYAKFWILQINYLCFCVFVFLCLCLCMCVCVFLCETFYTGLEARIGHGPLGPWSRVPSVYVELNEIGCIEII